jgi:hypothetical protein
MGLLRRPAIISGEGIPPIPGIPGIPPMPGIPPIPGIPGIPGNPGKPPKPGGKVGRGGECSSGTEFERNQLLVLGGILRKEAKPDLGLNEETILRKRIQNSVRVCAVNDLALRFMDKIGLQKKRWFYRPLEAKLHKHPLR